MRKILLVSLVLLGTACDALPEGNLAVERRAATAEQCATAMESYQAYLLQARCNDAAAMDCLEETSYRATRSDGRRVIVGGVFRWRSVNDTWPTYGTSTAREQLLPHFLTGYIKKLRNAYEACPAMLDQVYNQVDYMVSEARTRGEALVWENRHGLAQGMEQAELALLFSGIAKIHASYGDAKHARGTLGLSLRLARGAFIAAGVGTGGFRSADQTACAAKTARLRPCFWFHSRGVGIDEPGVRTVLNQHLHVVRDLLDLSARLRHLQADHPDVIPTDVALPAGPWTTWADAFEDRAIGGLYTLAFSNGHKAVAPTRPPNLAQFMSYHAPVAPYYRSYYSAHYGFELSTGKGYDIARQSTCHYQTHVMDLLFAIHVHASEHHAEGLLSPDRGWRVFEALDRLFLDPAEVVGAPGSKSFVFQVSRTDSSFVRTMFGCTDGGLAGDALAFFQELFARG